MEEMLYVQMILLKKDASGVIRDLADLGVFHPITSESGAGNKDLGEPEIGELRTRVEKLLTVSPGDYRVLPDLDDLPWGAALEGMEKGLSELNVALGDAKWKYREHRLLMDTMGEIPDSGYQKFFEAKYPKSHKIVLARIPKGDGEHLTEGLLGDLPNLLIPARDDTSLLICAIGSDDAHRLESALGKTYLVKLEPTEDPYPDLDAIGTELKARRKALITSIEEEKKRLWETTLGFIHRELLIREKVRDWKQGFFSEGRLMFITGYIPKTTEEEVVSAVKARVGERILMEVRPPKKGDPTPPTALKGSKLTMAFQSLLCTYGHPEYGQLNPTNFFALTYMIMFGFMFGDVGQGLVLLLGGLLLTRGGIKALERFRSTGPFLMGIGLTATIFGFLYGSLFGSEEILPALWVRPMEDVTTFLFMGVLVGTIMLSAGMIMKILNLVREGDPFKVFFHEYGVLSTLLYWSALGGGVLIFLGKKDTGSLLLVGGAVLLVLKVLAPLILGKALSRKVNTVETVFGVFEVILTFFTNTLSFARLSAFTLAHGALGAAVCQIANITGELTSGYSLPLLVMIFGNALVILLEGMVAGIQALRLEFYEILPKFFSGGGAQYKPMKFKSP